MTTTCFICGLKISDAEGHALSTLNIDLGHDNQASYICKRYHKKKMERQVKRDVKFEQLEKRVQQLEVTVKNLLSIPPPWLGNPNGHHVGCTCPMCGGGVT